MQNVILVIFHFQQNLVFSRIRIITGNVVHGAENKVWMKRPFLFAYDKLRTVPRPAQLT